MANDRQFIVEILNAQGVPTGRLIASRINVIESRVTGTTPSAAASLATFAGNGQSGTVGTVLTVPPSVRVTDASGLPVAGSTVTWQPGGGSGTTSTGNTSTTNSNGVAQVGSWSMGTTAGSAYTLFAYSGNLTNSPIRFSVTPTAGSAFSITMSGGTSQTTTPLGTLPSRLTVLVHDQYGNPVSGVTSALSTTDGDAALSTSIITTNASGLAGFTYQAGTQASVQSIYATIPSGASVQFASTTTSGPANHLTVDGGDNQVAQSSTTLPVPISGGVDDGFGNPVGSGNTVQFVIVSGSGNISRATQTPINSVWSVEWRTGAAVGQQLLEVSLLGVSNSTVTVRASATAPKADTIAIESGNSQTGTVNAALALPLAVACTGSGSSSSGQVVVFALSSNPGTAGSISTSVTVSSTSGIARTVLSLGTTVGTYTVSASAGTLTGSPLLFSATAMADAASQLRVSTEPSSQVQPGVAWTQQPVIITADQYGNLVSTNTRVGAVLLSGDGTLASGISMFATASGATASFSGLSYTQTSRQTFQVGFRCNSLSTTTASVQTAAPPFATRMAFTQQPGNILPGGLFSPVLTVALQDDGGNTVTTATDAVTLAISGGGTLSGTVTQNASGGIATFTGLGVTSGTPEATYTLAASATGLIGATSASFNVITTSADYPNEPGYALLAQASGTNAPTLNAESACDIAGQWIKFSGTYSSIDAVVNHGTTPPISPPMVGRMVYTASQVIGTASVNAAVWSDPAPVASSPEKSRFYMGIWFNMFGNGANFEMAVTQIKPFGYIAYGRARTSGNNEGYWVAQTLQPAGSQVTTLRLDFRQQGHVNRVIQGNTTINVNQWYLLEAEFICNSAAGVADGIMRQWITPYGGTSTLWINRSDVQYITAGNTNKFYWWHLHNIYGGAGSLTKTRSDYVMFDDFKITGDP